MNYLVTGAAGFIGMHTALSLLAQGHFVVGVDSINSYYDPQLKKDRLSQISHPNFVFVQADITSRGVIDQLFAKYQFQRVIHLAAQAGVRYSLENPFAYCSSNLEGFLVILECCRQYRIEHLVFASSSSVYGMNQQMPFSEAHPVDHPISLYAASKKANEVMAHAYASAFGLPVSGLRFFTVYGPWGRPDMAFHKFTKAIFEGKPIDVYNHGKMRRAFTYVDDIVEAVVRLSDKVATPDPNFDPYAPNPSTSSAPFRVYNIGGEAPVELGRFIRLIEKAVGREALQVLKPIQNGDVENTEADCSVLWETIGFTPQVSIEEGVNRSVEWFRRYYRLEGAPA